MTPPAAYTELTLAKYMYETLGQVAVSMEYLAPVEGDMTSRFQNAVDQALLDYGESNIALITGAENIRKLRAIARVQAWTAVLNDVTGDYDFRTAVDAQFMRSQVHKQATKQLDAAMSEALRLGVYVLTDGAYQVSRQQLIYVNDPYAYLPDSEREL